jgi:hypothetical protein
MVAMAAASAPNATDSDLPSVGADRDTAPERRHGHFEAASPG